MRGHDWQAIRDKFPLSEIAGQSVALKKAGRQWEGCCPFHQEKTPSFKINDERGFGHCFGCGWHGDVIDFVATMNNMDTAGAIAHLTGGKAPRLTEQERAERQKWLAAQEKARALAQASAIERARLRWDRAHPVEGANSYLERKKIAPHMARIEGANLILPIYDGDGEIMSVQTIAADGSKLFAKDAPVSLGRLNIGMFFGRVIICEGFATGASIFEAIPDQVCIAFSKANVANIAREYANDGIPIVIAADNNAVAEMKELATELDCPIAHPPSSVDDFNDQAVSSGIDGVRATIAQALIDYQNRPPPPPAEPECSIEFVDVLDFDESNIPVRPWIIPGAMLAGSTHILAAPGGTGKSLFTLQLGLMLAAGMKWGRWTPRRTCRVLIINAEDDIDEQHRRMAAARRVMGVDTAALAGRIMVARNPSSILIAELDKNGRGTSATPLVKELRAIIRHHEIDVVIVDPFTETFDGEENSNDHAKWAMKIWRDDVARATGCAVYLVHHTTKHSEDKAGSSDAVRGAGAMVNSARLAATLFVMTAKEASAMGIDDDQRFRYVRYDDAKSNQSLIGARQWFEKVSVAIGNGVPGESESADEVGALKPWDNSGFGGHDPDVMLAMLVSINDGYVDEDGVITDLPFGRTSAGGSKRWVGYPIGAALDLNEDHARNMIRLMIDKGVLEEYEYEDLNKGRKARGIRADMKVANDVFVSPPN